MNARRAALLALAAALAPACSSSDGPSVPALGVSPDEVRVGAELVIAGPSFGMTQGASTVAVGGAPAPVVSWSNHEVRVTVPAAALSGDVQLNVSGIPMNPGSVTILWPQSNPVNVAVGSGTGDQELVETASDGALGLLLVWRDTRNGNADIYAQRLSVAGAPLWTAGGVAVCTDLAAQDLPRIVSDGAGGALVAWQDARTDTGDIYAQRLNALGVPQWTPNGLPVCAVGQNQESVRMAADGAGGAFLAWNDLRSGSGRQTFAQRIDGSGAGHWTAGGIPLSAVLGAWELDLAADGAGDVLLCWNEIHSSQFDLFAQKLDGATGAAAWTAGGVPIGNAATSQSRGIIAPDGAGGALIAWSDYSTHSDIRAQRLDAAGGALWGADGVAVCTEPDSQDHAKLVPTAGGGMILAWQDLRLGAPQQDLFAQRLDGAGAKLWSPASGLPVCTAVQTQGEVRVISDGAGGAMLAWQDFRGATYDIYAQRLSGSGGAQWAANGVAVCSATGGQHDVRILPDGSGGAFLAWRDARSGVDVYAQRLTGLGNQ